jgi:hypothetical protein
MKIHMTPIGAYRGSAGRKGPSKSVLRYAENRGLLFPEVNDTFSGDGTLGTEGRQKENQCGE